MLWDFRTVTIDDLADLLEQKGVWVNGHGEVHEIEDVPRDYLAQLMTELQDEAVHLMRATQCARTPEMRAAWDRHRLAAISSVLSGKVADPLDPLDAAGVPVPTRSDALAWIRSRPLMQALQKELQLRDAVRNFYLLDAATGGSGEWLVMTAAGVTRTLDLENGSQLFGDEDVNRNLWSRSDFERAAVLFLASRRGKPVDATATAFAVDQRALAERFTTPVVHVEGPADVTQPNEPPSVAP